MRTRNGSERTEPSAAAQGLTERLAKYSSETSFEKLPDHVVDHTKRVILDTLGCMVLGSDMAPGEILRKFVTAQRGVQEASVVRGGARVPVALAGLANGTAAHADELDASHRSWSHPAASAVPACLAVSEYQGLDGRELINSVVLAHDVGCRMLTAFGGRQAVLDAHHCHSSMFNAVGVALAVGKLLRLEQTTMKHALALSAANIYAPAAFLDEQQHMAKGMTHGQAAYAAITGGLLASYGLRGNEAIIEARHGLAEAWWTDETDLSLLTSDLGQHHVVMDTGFKYYSAGYPIHAPLYGALQIMREHSLSAADVKHVRVGMTSQSAEIVDSRPMASICLQDMVSVGIVRGRLAYEDAHDPNSTADDEVRRLRSSIVIVRDPEMDSRKPRSRSAWVEIETTDGRTCRADEQPPPGHWDRGGMPWKDVRSKFASLVERRLGKDASDRIIAIVERLEDQETVRELGDALAE